MRNAPPLDRGLPPTGAPGLLSAMAILLFLSGLAWPTPTLGADLAGSEPCLLTDFDDDDDPWTIDTEARGSEAEFRWVFECPEEQPWGLWIDVQTSCCGGVNVDFDDLVFNPLLVERVWEITTRQSAGGSCWVTGVSLEFFDDAPFVVGERYFLATGLAEGNCSSCSNENVWFRTYPYGYDSCDGLYHQASFDCFEPLGACCAPSGSCVSLTEDECEDIGGIHQGWDTRCEPDPCPPAGACCLDDGSCIIQTEFGCSDRAGDYLGDFSVCDGDPCPPGGACCMDDGSCSILTSDVCSQSGGGWLGSGTSCDPVPCAPAGVCCLADGVCGILTEDACAAQVGVWDGATMACTPYPCPPILVRPDGSGDVSTIAQAIANATSGAVIELDDGVYLGHDNRTWDFDRKRLTIRSLSGDPSDTIVDGQHFGGALYDFSTQAGTKVESVTLRNLVHGVVVGEDGRVELRDVRVEGCQTTSGAVRLIKGFVELYDCSFIGNTSEQEGAAISAADGILVSGCTIAYNYAENGAAIFAHGSDPAVVTLQRSILWENCTPSGFRDFSVSGNDGAMTVECSLIDTAFVEMEFVSGTPVLGDPAFCGPPGCMTTPTTGYVPVLAANSICLPGGNSCGVLIGAEGLGCDAVELGACCSEDGECRVLNLESCEQRSGEYFGNESCDPAPCIPPAVCCFNYDCQLLPPFFCAEQGGESYPNELVCDPSPCTNLLVLADGTGPFATIQEAIDFAVSGSTIRLGDGVFEGTGNRYLFPAGKDLVIRSENGNAKDCIIDCSFESGAGWGLSITSGEGPEMRLEDITIRNGSGNWGGAAKVINSSPTFRRCIFESCQGNLGGALYLSGSQSRVEDCVFIGNEANNKGGAIYMDGTSTVDITGSTFFGNVCEEGSAIHTGSPGLNVSRSVFVANMDGIPVSCDSAAPSVSCTDIFGNPAGDWAGCLSGMENLNDNFSVDPLFCDASLGDLSLYSTSPCLPDQSPCGELVGALGQGCLDPASTDLEPALPTRLALAAPQPNPATHACDIQFDLPSDGWIELSLVDASGRLVAVPLSEHRTAGRHSVNWVGTDRAGGPLASGVYYVKLRAGGEESRSRLVWIR